MNTLNSHRPFANKTTRLKTEYHVDLQTEKTELEARINELNTKMTSSSLTPEETNELTEKQTRLTEINTRMSTLNVTTHDVTKTINGVNYTLSNADAVEYDKLLKEVETYDGKVLMTSAKNGRFGAEVKAPN